VCVRVNWLGFRCSVTCEHAGIQVVSQGRCARVNLQKLRLSVCGYTGRESGKECLIVDELVDTTTSGWASTPVHYEHTVRVRGCGGHHEVRVSEFTCKL
jgi:hypothetical protein